MAAGLVAAAEHGHPARVDHEAVRDPQQHHVVLEVLEHADHAGLPPALRAVLPRHVDADLEVGRRRRAAERGGRHVRARDDRAVLPDDDARAADRLVGGVADLHREVPQPLELDAAIAGHR